MQRTRILFTLILAATAVALVLALILLLPPSPRNDDWTPTTQEFAGVPMALVPAGCFSMGSDSGGDDEMPVHQQCFDAPFYIDQTEVTQAQFARLGGDQGAQASVFAGDNRPVERIAWELARDFCALRGGRLPTEAEWEYAARGPEGFVYPWGNEWNPENAVWAENSNGQTAEVGSLPAGASWVGALDMAGNVFEWTRSLYGPYPHDVSDAIGALIDDETHPVVRGGDWDARDPVIFRAANRRREFVGIGTRSIGFRCVRSAS